MKTGLITSKDDRPEGHKLWEAKGGGVVHDLNDAFPIEETEPQTDPFTEATKAVSRR